MARLIKKFKAEYDDTGEVVSCELYSSTSDLYPGEPYLTVLIDGQLSYVEGTLYQYDTSRTRIKCTRDNGESFYLKIKSAATISAGNEVFDTPGTHTIQIPGDIHKLLVTEVQAGSYMDFDVETGPDGIIPTDYEKLITRPDPTYFDSSIGDEENPGTGLFDGRNGIENKKKALITGYTKDLYPETRLLIDNINTLCGLPYYRYSEKYDKYFIAPSGACTMRYVDVTPGSSYNIYVGNDGYTKKFGSNPNAGSFKSETIYTEPDNPETTVLAESNGDGDYAPPGPTIIEYDKPGTYTLHIPLNVSSIILNMCGGGGLCSRGNFDSSYTEKFGVLFDAQGGTPEPEGQVVNAGDYAIEPPIPTKAGYTFDGWEEFTPNTNSRFGSYLTCNGGGNGTSSDTANVPDIGGVGGGSETNPSFVRVIDIEKYGYGQTGYDIPSLSCTEINQDGLLVGGAGGKAGRDGEPGNISFLGILDDEGNPMWYKSCSGGGSGQFIENKIIEVTPGEDIEIFVADAGGLGAGPGYCRVEYRPDAIPTVEITGYPNTGFVAIQYGPLVENEDSDNFVSYDYNTNFINNITENYIEPKKYEVISLWTVRINIMEYSAGITLVNPDGTDEDIVEGQNPTLYYFDDETHEWKEHSELPDSGDIINIGGDIYSTRWKLGYKNIDIKPTTKYAYDLYFKSVEISDI